MPKSKSTKSKRQSLPKHLSHLNINAAGIDIGSKSHYVAVPEGRDEKCVREFESFTGALHELADWLKACQIETVAMESTGVYWIPLFELLEERGFEVFLVDARKIKNVSGRKTDVLDCQWIQQLHTYGLLSGAFRPSQQICQLRAYLRHREMLIDYAASHTQHMQKSLTQMNLQLHNVISNITGKTGMKIIRAIVSGERDPFALAKFRDRRCKKSEEIIASSLQGHYRLEHLFTLKEALVMYDCYQDRIKACDAAIEQILQQFEVRADADELAIKKKTTGVKNNSLKFDARKYLYQLTGVDLTAIAGIDAHTALKIISEVGLDMSRWKGWKQFGSWLGLAPGNKVSGGKILSGKTKPSANRAANALRLAANSLYRSSSALGAYLRRQKARLGAPKAITATAYKLAKVIYIMLKNRVEFYDLGESYYEQQYKKRTLRHLKFKAQKLGFNLVSDDNLTENVVA